MLPKKKSVPKKPPKKKTEKRKVKKSFTEKKEVELPKSEIKVEKILIENFVSLQKVMVNLSVKFDNLTAQLSKLLDLFEISAKTLAEKEFKLERGNRDDAKVLEKIDAMLDQNKTIARGLTLMHEKISEQPGYPPASNPEKSMLFKHQKSSFRPLPKPVIKQEGGDEYHRSISSQEKEFP